MAYRSRSGLRGIFYTPGFPPGVKWLLLSNVAVFILGFFAQLLQLDRPLSAFALFPVDVVRHLKIWQLATYLFLHGGFGHIIWNMLALWMFGAELERTWGTRKFLQFYFFCGVGAGICVVLANYLLPWGNPAVATIGSSGAIFGILMAYAVLYPDRTILWGFLIPIKVKYFVLIIGTISFLSSFQVNSGSASSPIWAVCSSVMCSSRSRETCSSIWPVRHAAGTRNGSFNAPRRNSRCTCASRARIGTHGFIDRL